MLPLLPRHGDILVITENHDDVTLLHQQDRFSVVVGESGSEQPVDDLHRRLTRSLAFQALPFPPGVFASAWIRCRGQVNSDLVARALRSVRPDGPVTVVLDVGAADRLSQATAAMRTVATSCGSVILGEGPESEGGYVWILRRQAAGHEGPPCDFCEPWRFRLNARAGLPGAAGVLWGDDDLYLIPDVSPVSAGHLLLVTSRHHLSMSAAPAPTIGALDGCTDRIDELFRRAYGRPAVFLEHGSTRGHPAGACIEHAHWHCLPDLGDILDQIARWDLRGRRHALDDLAGLRDSAYLLVRTHGETWVFDAENLPCQFLRLIVTEARHRPAWRWQQLLDTPQGRELVLDTLGVTIPAADMILAGTSPSAVPQGAGNE